MDEDYARLLRDWLRAAPGTPNPRPDADDVAIPLPRLSDENRRRTETKEQGGLALPRDPENLREAEERTDQESRSAAEERSRWNHPSNWHRRKAAERAEIGDRVAEPEAPRWPLRDPDHQPGRPSRSDRLDEQRPWRELDDAIDRSRREELDAAQERNRSNDNDDPEDRSR